MRAESGATGLAASDATDWRVEMFRAIAAVMVMVVHYLHYFGGTKTLFLYFFTGVDLFFVLSGFVFAPYLLRGRRLEPAPFFIRRFFRLFPLYLLSLGAYGVLRWGDPQLPAMLWKHALMAHTLESRAIAFYFNPAYWSLPPEVEFYLLLPAMAWLCRMRWGFVALVGIAVVMRVIVTAMLPAGHLDESGAAIASFHLPGLLLEFLFGVMAWGWVAREKRQHALRCDSALLGAGVLLSVGWAIVVVGQLSEGGDALLHANPLTRGNVAMVAALGYALIVAGAMGLVSQVEVPQRVQRFALWAGGCSYAIYLLHLLAPAVLHKANPALAGPALGIAAAAVTIAAASLLHSLFEDPMRRWGRRIASRRTQAQQPLQAGS